MKLIKLLALFMALLIFSIPFVFAAQTNFFYDSNGNVVWDGETYREYNSLNQLSAVYNGSDNTTLLAEYLYHPIEERVHVKKVYEEGSWKETIIYDPHIFL